MKKDKEIEEFVDEALGNVRNDRALAFKSDHQSMGNVAGKYLETLQRSNEQLTKLITTMSKQSSGSMKISEDDIYKMIEEDKKDGKTT
jgi:hypothetical protein